MLLIMTEQFFYWRNERGFIVPVEVVPMGIRLVRRLAYEKRPLQHCIHSQAEEAEEIQLQALQLQGEGEELHWMPAVEGGQRILAPAAVAVAAGPSAGSNGSRRHNSDNRHRQHRDQNRNIEHTAHYNRLGLHLLRQRRAFHVLMDFRLTRGSAGWNSLRIHRRNTDLHAVRTHHSFVEADSL